MLNETIIPFTLDVLATLRHATLPSSFVIRASADVTDVTDGETFARIVGEVRDELERNGYVTCERASVETDDETGPRYELHAAKPERMTLN